jgi:hypothetical protein
LANEAGVSRNEAQVIEQEPVKAETAAHEQGKWTGKLETQDEEEKLPRELRTWSAIGALASFRGRRDDGRDMGRGRL